MNGKEFKQWFHEYQAAFPGIMRWLRENSPDVEKTLSRWKKALEPYELVECMRVIDDMADGVRAPVKPYERELTGQVVASYAGRIRDDQRQRERVARERSRLVQKPAKERWPAGKLFRKACELQPLVASGEITESEYKQRLREHLDRELATARE